MAPFFYGNCRNGAFTIMNGALQFFMLDLMRQGVYRGILVGVLTGSVWGCGGPLVGVTVVDERTALENQVLGSYEQLQEEVLLVASVRYIDPTGKLKENPKVPPGKREAFRALQRSSFNKDDIDRYKDLKVLGENNKGGITLLTPGTLEEKERGFVENLVLEENADREVLMRRIIETNENMTERDFPKIQRTFAALNRDKARPGDMVQLEPGEWVQKPGL